jgi:hypothetical protein
VVKVRASLAWAKRPVFLNRAAQSYKNMRFFHVDLSFFAAHLELDGASCGLGDLP